jgi:nitrate/nitrite transport system substrate-binding protein
MVVNMTAGNMDGFNVGEPWGAKAVADKVGFTFLGTQDLWKNHPEKALVVNGKFAEARRRRPQKSDESDSRASQFIDDKKNNQGSRRR